MYLDANNTKYKQLLIVYIINHMYLTTYNINITTYIFTKYKLLYISEFSHLFQRGRNIHNVIDKVNCVPFYYNTVFNVFVIIK